MEEIEDNGNQWADVNADAEKLLEKISQKMLIFKGEIFCTKYLTNLTMD